MTPRARAMVFVYGTSRRAGAGMTPLAQRGAALDDGPELAMTRTLWQIGYSVN
jgi:hypothetical protein